MASKQSLVNGDGDYISDDSSFYGDDDHRKSLEERASTFNPSAYWSTRHLTLPAIATSNLAKPHAPPPSSKPLYNFYEGTLSARQLAESVQSFLSRLPPLSTPSSADPWIYIANPHSPCRPTSEDWASFKTAGEAVLAAFKEAKASIDFSMTGRPAGTLTRKVTSLRKQVELDILAAAKKTGCTSGKWMLFPLPENVNPVWALVAEGTMAQELGRGAKVATDAGQGDRVPRLLCVYTEDFSEKGDVKRVLERLVRMGLVDRTGQGIYYKCDAYTHLGIGSGNEWGLKPSLYASKDVLAEAKR